MLNRILTVVGIYALIPFIWIARYDRPSADDYTYAVEFPGHSVAQVVRTEYMGWSGRYFSRVMYKLNPMAYHSLGGYRFFSLGLILLFVIVGFTLVRGLTRQYLSPAQGLSLAALLTGLYFAKVPGIAEAFYWFTGTSMYQLANILDMLLLLGVIRLATASRRQLPWLVLCSLLCIVIIGCNEVSLIITFLLVHGITIDQYLRNKRINPYLLALCFVCIVFAMIEIFAPGNFKRMEQTGQMGRSVIWTLAGSVSITAVYISQWIGPLLAASLLYIPLFGMRIAEKRKEQNHISVKHFLWFYLGTLALVQFFIIWVAGGSNLGRIFGVVFLFILFGWFVLLQLLLDRNFHRLEILQRHSFAFSLIGILLFTSCLLDLNNNVSTAYVDILSGKAEQYDHALQQREQLLRECRSDTCRVPDLKDIPSTLFFTDIRPLSDPGSLWINTYYSRYFGGGFVIVENPPPVARPNIEALKDMGRTLRQRLVR